MFTTLVHPRRETRQVTSTLSLSRRRRRQKNDNAFIGLGRERAAPFLLWLNGFPKKQFIVKVK